MRGSANVARMNGAPHGVQCQTTHDALAMRAGNARDQPAKPPTGRLACSRRLREDGGFVAVSWRLNGGLRGGHRRVLLRLLTALDGF